MYFWKFWRKYEKIQFFYRKFLILWPTTQKPTLRSQNSKISCLDPISIPSGQLWISKNSTFPILSFYFQWILNIHTFYFWGVIVSTMSQDFRFLSQQHTVQWKINMLTLNITSTGAVKPWIWSTWVYQPHYLIKPLP